MIVYEINLLLSVMDFILINQPSILLLVKVFKLWVSFWVQWGDRKVRNCCESMANKYLLNLLTFLEIQNSKEYFLFFLKIIINTSLFDKRVNHLIKLILDQLTIRAILFNIINHDNIIRSWISNDKFHVLVRIEFNYTILIFAFKLFNLLQFKLA